MSKKILRSMFLLSDVSTYDNKKPYSDPLINNIENKDFRIDKNMTFFLTIKVKKSGHTISWLLPKVILYLIVSLTITGLLTLGTFNISDSRMTLNGYIIANSILHGSFILTYVFFFIKNYELVRKYRQIQKSIRNRDKQVDDNTLKTVADDIINDNIKMLRKLKLEIINKNK